MNKSYTEYLTNRVTRYKDFARDFTKPGQFRLHKFDQTRLCLVHRFYPGLYLDGKWKKSEKIAGCMVEIIYKSKKQVEFEIELQDDIWRVDQKETADFLTSAGKKFFLVNDYAYNALYPFDLEPVKWEQVETEINECIEDLNRILKKGENAIHNTRNEKVSMLLKNIHKVNRWKKTMTLDEVKKVISYLQLKVKFPS